MPDIYLTISDAGPAVVEPLVDILEPRAADPGQRAMREAYFREVPFPAGVRWPRSGAGAGPFPAETALTM